MSFFLQKLKMFKNYFVIIHTVFFFFCSEGRKKLRQFFFVIFLRKKKENVESESIFINIYSNKQIRKQISVEFHYVEDRRYHKTKKMKLAAICQDRKKKIKKMKR